MYVYTRVCMYACIRVYPCMCIRVYACIYMFIKHFECIPLCISRFLFSSVENTIIFVVTFIAFVDFKHRSQRKGGMFFPLIILLSIKKQNLQFRNINKLIN